VITAAPSDNSFPIFTTESSIYGATSINNLFVFSTRVFPPARPPEWFPNVGELKITPLMARSLFKILKMIVIKAPSESPYINSGTYIFPSKNAYINIDLLEHQNDILHEMFD
jgi:hypothetical protein